LVHARRAGAQIPGELAPQPSPSQTPDEQSLADWHGEPSAAGDDGGGGVGATVPASGSACVTGGGGGGRGSSGG
jgi:hypothetical protein